MAFTEAQKLKICRITGVTSDLLEDVLSFRAAAITAEVESQVGDLITEYFANGVNRNVTKIRPNLKNFGADIDPNDTRAQIKGEIATLLYMTEVVSSGERLMRG